jgi:hypothetical protein
VLTVNDPSTIIADPGADEPNIVDSGQVLTVTPATAGIAVHVGGITLTNGASMIVTQADAPTTADLNNGEFVGSNQATVHNTLVIGVVGSANDPTFSIDGTSKLDLNDNDLIIHTGSSDSGYDSQGNAVSPTALANVQGLWNTGFVGSNGSYATGNGLTSSVAVNQDNSDGGKTVVLAIVDNGVYGTPFSTFDGESVGASDIIVKYTYNGDLNLDGVVDGHDSQIFNGWYDGGATSGNEYGYGDLNGDGYLTGQDSQFFNGVYQNGTVNSQYGAADAYQL